MLIFKKTKLYHRVKILSGNQIRIDNFVNFGKETANLGYFKNGDIFGIFVLQYECAL